MTKPSQTDRPKGRQGKKKSLAARGWLPNQHGAWAMLAVPFIVGVVLRSRAGRPLEGWLIPLAVAELAAYLAFNVLGLWLHVAPARRAGFRTPMIAFGGLTALSAVLVIVLGGAPLLWWLPVAAPLMGWAIWLTSRRQDRSVTSGLVTVGLAVGMGLALLFPDPRELLSGSPEVPPALATFVALFGYFAGTVWHVKSLIREWANPQARSWSVGWHAAFTILSTVAAITGLLNPGWPVFFAVCTLRSWWLTRLDRRPKPKHVGLLEVAMSLVILVIALI